MRMRFLFLSGLLGGLLLIGAPAQAFELEDPANFRLENTWSGTDLGVPGRLGALFFSVDGSTLYVVGNAEASSSALYAVEVTRSAQGRVVDLGPATTTTTVFEGTLTGLDTGLEIGPLGTLFYTYWSANHLGQRPGGFAGAETLYDMATYGVPRSVAGLTFSPHRTDPGTAFGQMQVSSWQGDDIFELPLTPATGGLFTPGDATLFVSLPQEGTGAIQYVPSGLFEGDLMYVNWNYGEVRILAIDEATGLPIDQDTGEPTLGTENPVDQRFAWDLGIGPWGLEFDGASRDFFISTWNGDPSNSILQITGVGFTGDPDAGPVPDAGPPDGGPPDGGTPVFDGGVADPDAGGAIVDAGPGLDAGVPIGPGSGCDCRVGESTGQLPGSFLLGLAFATFLVRRRYRWRLPASASR
jgi:MYXO-CTERM domain-containing protein